MRRLTRARSSETALGCAMDGGGWWDTITLIKWPLVTDTYHPNQRFERSRGGAPILSHSYPNEAPIFRTL